MIIDDWWQIIDYLHTENADGYGCPQADEGGEQVSINDERWMIVDCLHTENAEDTNNSRIWQSEFIEPT